MSENTSNNPNPQTPPRGNTPPPYPPPVQRKRSGNWWIPLIIVGAILFIFVIFIVSLGGMVGNAFKEKDVTVESNSVLLLNFGKVEEYTEANPFAQIFGGGQQEMSYLDLLKSIERAKDDDKIKGIYYNISLSQSLGAAKNNEFREKLREFKESGKFIYAFIEAGNENMYYNAILADSIFMPTEGLLEMNGFGTSGMFFDAALNEFGVDFYVQQFEDFKSAGESFSRNSYSDSAKYQIRVLLQQRMDYFVDAVAKERNLDKDMIIGAMNRGLYSADSLLAYGFIDSYATDLQVRDYIKSRVLGEGLSFDEAINKIDTSKSDDDSEKFHFISISKYSQSKYEPKKEVWDKDKQIAIIYGSGPITSGKKGSDNMNFGDDLQIKSGDYVQYLKEARDDDKIKAIILRIDSPGGSVIASEEIYEEIIKARKVKPVYASMSDVAASGGYYMAMACDTIIAHPTTITGSIGVILSIPNLSGMVNKLKIGIDTLSTTNAAQFMNGMYPFTDSDKQQLYTLSRGIYDRFVSKVAISRGMTFEETRALAKGRVWTGQDAYERNLVDVLGGLEESIELAKQRIGVPEGELVYVQTFPKPEDEFKALLKAFGLDPEASVSKSQSFEGYLKQTFAVSPEKLLTNWVTMPDYMKEEILYGLKLAEISKRENALVALPNLINIK